jgi:hypothetical protein
VKCLPTFALASVAAFRNELLPALGLPTQPITKFVAIIGIEAEYDNVQNLKVPTNNA